jgi:hypothetical protein
MSKKEKKIKEVKKSVLKGDNEFPIIQIMTWDGVLRDAVSLLQVKPGATKSILTIRPKADTPTIGIATVYVQHSPIMTDDDDDRWFQANWDNGNPIQYTGNVYDIGPAEFPVCGQFLRLLVDTTGSGLQPEDIEAYLL